MKFKKDQLYIALLLIIIFIIAGCRSVPREIPDDLLPEEFFRLAQTAMVDWGNHRAALFYYEEFINRFPDMRGKIIEAEYEIAFIHFKRRHYDEARRRFESILAQYETPESIHFNEWPRVLSIRILETIDQRQYGRRAGR
ncbi:MAG: tetratricopeptide repeat protein [Spirochaetaceae bacterium]|nr:tetratricopeptide repeat protein [Spirochaetaceae bacterium]